MKKYHIGNFTYMENNKRRKEYYVSGDEGIVAGDFRSYQAALTYIKTTLSKPTRTTR